MNLSEKVKEITELSKAFHSKETMPSIDKLIIDITGNIMVAAFVNRSTRYELQFLNKDKGRLIKTYFENEGFRVEIIGSDTFHEKYLICWNDV